MKPPQRLTIAPEQILADQRLRLTDEQGHYLQRVLRLKPGDIFWTQDGRGQQWKATLDTQPGQALILETLATSQLAPLKPPLILAAALPKSGFDDVVRQATEIGVTQIQPLTSERSLLQPSMQKIERWQRIAQEASEQSEQIFVPQVFMPISLTDWFNRTSTETQAYICVTRGSYPLLIDHLQRVLAISPQHSILLTIGPEGGWSEREIAEAVAKNYQPVSLGSGILRATTASLVALAVVSTLREQLI
jgi:16S rRNA (uracil1498-N3)-methyltransferase